MTRRTLVVLTALVALLLPASAQAEFGFVPGKAEVNAENAKGGIERRAGAHPFAYTIHFELNTDAEGNPEGEMRDVVIKTPPGFVGNPQAIPTCPRQSFEGGIPKCLPSTQVGVLHAIVPGIGEVNGPIYNLTPPPGVVTQFGFSSPAGLFSLQSASVLPEEGYRVSVSAPDLPLAVTSVTATIWGTPADHAHDAERDPGGVASEAPLLPYLTMPTSCLAPPTVRIEVDSKENPGAFIPEDVPMREAGKEVTLSGCEAVPFKPAILSAPTTSAADSPAGLGFELQLEAEGLLNPNEGSIAETQPTKTEVTLPAGMTANPAAAGGLVACSTSQFAAASADAPGCPPDSKLGTLVAHTPLLAEPIEGSVYLAKPHDNPFDSLLAIYIVASAPERGVLVKQAGEVEADPVTGRLTTTFDNLPPVPYSSFEVKLREGPRAPLITPQLCGEYTTQARLYPFSDPGTATVRTAPFTISSGAGGAPCAGSEARLPAHPRLEAGPTSTLAASYAPFVFNVSRTDGEQRFASISATLPKGLSGKLAGIPSCSEAQLATAKAREREGGGTEEKASPSCPQASRVGTVDVAAGAGPSPYYVQGKAYLAPPYKSAPLSLAIIVPAVAGPFDLGAVLSRAPLYIDEETAQVTVKSDPIPTILQGIPLDVRTISLNADRDRFTLNPTGCEAKQIDAALLTTTGATTQLQNRFQVGGCANLPFKPKLSIAFKGSAQRRSHPEVIATLKAKPGEAGISFAQVKLPKAAFLDQAHIKTVCTRVQFNQGAGNGAGCPPGSVYGKAEAKTPLLDYPLKGTVYLRSNPAHTLPDLVVAFQGPDYQPIHFALAGKTDSVKGALRNTFQAAPDVPVSSFRLELFGGKRGLVILSGGLCAHRAATVRFKAHSGREYSAGPTVGAKCGRKQRPSP